MTSTETDASRRVLDHPAVARARELIFELDEETLATQVELTEIPAPPFGEEARAARMVEHLRSAGLEEVRLDAVGNVIGELRGPEGGSAHPGVVVAAHLDTVFPPETDVTVRQDDDRLVGPGISDDGRGLAALVTIARVLSSFGATPSRSIRFVATVGEEGEGNLRGAKHVFSTEEGRRIGAFISLDGAGLGRIVTRGLGVRRLRLVATGPGGHSWVDREAPNPIHALAHAVASMDRLELPGIPPTGLTVARWGGGSSINAVPREAWIELDLRSESGNSLRELEDQVRRLAAGSVATANAGGNGRTPISLRIDVIGDRPAGATDPDSALVQAAVDATYAVGHEPELVASSTDSNIPMSLGIPAITMGSGGEAGNAHTPDEWFRNRKGPEGVLRALLTVLLAVGIEES